MNDYLGRPLRIRLRDTLFVFGFCGIVSVFTGLDHIWKILGLEEPFTLTWFPGRCLHTTLVFILYGVIPGSIAFAYANRQGYFRWSMDISRKRNSRGIPSVCRDVNFYDCNSCKYKFTCSKEVEIT